jgi:exonuclease SbcC
LKLSGFLSYRDPVELDFTSFDLACISGPNGAGKSSLLDAMTWALFGQARKRDESIVNLQSKAAEVAFAFTYEGNEYRVIRALRIGKTTTLEFQISDDGPQTTDERPQAAGRGPSSNVHRPRSWRPLTERTLRETQARIEQVLRLDYETFVNVSFFLQGRADQFAQQPPSKRKEILGSILGLEAWEVYRERAAVRRKGVEAALAALDGRLQEIEAELAEEPQRREGLARLDQELARSSGLRKAQEAALANVKQVRAALDKQRELVRKLGEGLERVRTNLAGLEARRLKQETERRSQAALLGRASEVEAAYAVLGRARLDLEKWEQTAGRFREHESLRQPLLAEIAAEQARLEEERRRLGLDREAVEKQAAAAAGLEAELEAARRALAAAEAQAAERAGFQKQAQAAREQQAGLRAENAGLKAEMDEIKARIEKLAAADGVACPLCGQSLTPEHRKTTLQGLREEGKALGDRWRANKAAAEQLAGQIADIDARILDLAPAEAERMKLSGAAAQLSERLEAAQAASAAWAKTGAKRLAAVEKLLEAGKFASDARRKLARVDKDLAALGYDAAAHDAARRTDVQARPAEAEYRSLESARSALKPIEDELENLQSQIADQHSSIHDQQSEYDSALAALTAAEAAAPDLDSAEQTLFDLQEQENRLNQEVGAARQKVDVLDDLRSRKRKLGAEREGLGLQVGRYKSLERAFGKDGVPALLIEQALPEIELKANEILGRLSGDSMHVHFETQAKYKDEKRLDLRETLEIQVSDGAGQRDYETFSGGEAFRVNFAIRLALSEVLAGRKGARLQMLVVDEGFGSQDALGRDRLIQAINAVKADFAKILVITHLEELKDAFPTRIEVEKGENGSRVKVW